MIVEIRKSAVCATIIVCIGAAPAALAGPSTTDGKISVGQVMDMIDGAQRSDVARQVLVAYLAGVGEAAGAMTLGGTWSTSCDKPLTLDVAGVREALSRSAKRRDDWNETAATPIIVDHMLRKAGCRARSG